MSAAAGFSLTPTAPAGGAAAPVARADLATPDPVTKATNILPERLVAAKSIGPNSLTAELRQLIFDDQNAYVKATDTDLDKAMSNAELVLGILNTSTDDNDIEGAHAALNSRINALRKLLEPMKRGWGGWVIGTVKWWEPLITKIDEFKRIVTAADNTAQSTILQKRITQQRFLRFSDSSARHIRAVFAATADTRTSVPESAQRISKLTVDEITRSFFNSASEAYLETVGMPKVAVEVCPIGSIPLFVDKNSPLDTLFREASGAQLVSTPTDREVGYCVGSAAIDVPVLTERVFNNATVPGTSDLEELFLRIPRLDLSQREALQRTLTMMTRGMRPPVDNGMPIKDALTLLGDDDFMENLRTQNDGTSGATSMTAKYSDPKVRATKRAQFEQLAATTSQVLRARQRPTSSSDSGPGAQRVGLETLLQEFIDSTVNTLRAHKAAKDVRRARKAMLAAGANRPELTTSALREALVGAAPGTSSEIAFGGGMDEEEEARQLKSKSAVKRLAKLSNQLKQTAMSLSQIAQPYRADPTMMNITRAYLVALVTNTLFWHEHKRRISASRELRVSRGKDPGPKCFLFVERSGETLSRYFSTIAREGHSEEGVCYEYPAASGNYTFATDFYSDWFRVEGGKLQLMVPDLIDQGADLPLGVAWRWIDVLPTAEALHQAGTRNVSSHPLVRALNNDSSKRKSSSRRPADMTLAERALSTMSAASGNFYTDGVFMNMLVIEPMSNTAQSAPCNVSAVLLQNVLTFARQPENARLELTDDATPEQTRAVRQSPEVALGYMVPRVVDMMMQQLAMIRPRTNNREEVQDFAIQFAELMTGPEHLSKNMYALMMHYQTVPDASELSHNSEAPIVSMNDIRLEAFTAMMTDLRSRKSSSVALMGREGVSVRSEMRAALESFSQPVQQL